LSLKQPQAKNTFVVLAGNRVKRLKNGGCIKVDVLHIYAKRELKVNKYPKPRLQAKTGVLLSVLKNIAGLTYCFC
jgi:hypothetical protein